MIGRYLYINHISDTIKCPTCGAGAVSSRAETTEKRRLSYAMCGNEPWFILGNNPLPTNLVLYGDCDCGEAVPFVEPGDVALFVDVTLPEASGATPLFDDPAAARRYGKRRRENPNAGHFALAKLP